MQSDEGKVECVFCTVPVSPTKSERSSPSKHASPIQRWSSPRFDLGSDDEPDFGRDESPSSWMRSLSPTKSTPRSNPRRGRFLEIPDHIDLDDDKAILSLVSEAKKAQSFDARSPTFSLRSPLISPASLSRRTPNSNTSRYNRSFSPTKRRYWDSSSSPRKTWSFQEPPNAEHAAQPSLGIANRVMSNIRDDDASPTTPHTPKRDAPEHDAFLRPDPSGLSVDNHLDLQVSTSSSMGTPGQKTPEAHDSEKQATDRPISDGMTQEQPSTDMGSPLEGKGSRVSSPRRRGAFSPQRYPFTSAETAYLVEHSIVAEHEEDGLYTSKPVEQSRTAEQTEAESNSKDTTPRYVSTTGSERWRSSLPLNTHHDYRNSRPVLQHPTTSSITTNVSERLDGEAAKMFLTIPSLQPEMAQPVSGNDSAIITLKDEDDNDIIRLETGENLTVDFQSLDSRRTTAHTTSTPVVRDSDTMNTKTPSAVHTMTRSPNKSFASHAFPPRTSGTDQSPYMSPPLRGYSSPPRESPTRRSPTKRDGRFSMERVKEIHDNTDEMVKQFEQELTPLPPDDPDLDFGVSGFGFERQQPSTQSSQNRNRPTTFSNEGPNQDVSIHTDRLTSGAIAIDNLETTFQSIQ